MDTRILTPHVLHSVRTQSALLDHEPVFERTEPFLGYSEWVCVHGWCMPVQFWHILCMWCMMHNKVYMNKLEPSMFTQTLTQVNENHKALQDKPTHNILDVMFADVYTWVLDHLDHGKFLQWYNQVIEQMDTM